MDCPELKAAAEDFFQLHFTEVYKLDEFLQLNVTQLTHLLHQDKLTVRAEAQVRVHFLLISQFHLCHWGEIEFGIFNIYIQSMVQPQWPQNDWSLVPK